MKQLQNLLNFSLINLDKPTGPTSFQISQFVKNSLHLAKTSHMGTLDPQVTGVLPVTLGRACKLSEYFMHKDKKYVGIMRIHEDLPLAKLKKLMKEFTGKITQLPPVKSRVKRAFREREVKQFEISEKKGKDVLFVSEVQAGTYIRKLCSDLGEKIGGAHMLELRRTKASIFSENDDNFVNLYDFEKAVNALNEGNETPLRKMLIPAEQAIQKVLPVAKLSNKNLGQILTGKPLCEEDFLEPLQDDLFAAFHEDKFIGVYRAVKEKDIIARAEFVFN
ncbi:MAG: RNA-guided pseudouridylation complex pseudouridine synthase subunit Cbf5 [Nanoarchaeota archaeon]|nr:RNA-guided pseudouridylation complex pseudouridine synthase subunit Cbf5 [Nanoarchaeota archaeon]MBU1103955.1 RNA-guided pseudouridylation complex pseudouridine synthase subunit Cbf5 [Nanoarchaeota archaeon]